MEGKVAIVVVLYMVIIPMVNPLAYGTWNGSASSQTKRRAKLKVERTALMVRVANVSSTFKKLFSSFQKAITTLSTWIIIHMRLCTPARTSSVSHILNPFGLSHASH